MKKLLAVLMVLCVLTAATAAAFADSYSSYAFKWATSNRRLATRTGPGTQYDEPGSFNQAGTSYRILSKAYDYSNGIWWVQVEIKTNGGTIWAYTGVKRFDNLNLNSIPEEKILGTCTTSFKMTGYYAPTSDGCPIQRSVPAYADCTIYGYYYGGNGSDYILVEFYDYGLGQYRRAWIPDTFVDDYQMYYGF